MSAADESELLRAIFQIFARLTEIGEDVHKIREAVEEEDDGQEDGEG